MQLNSNQSIAINHVDGPALILAGPGSGKTTVLTQRIKALCDKGIDPASILVITFTKAASLEMKQRFDSLCTTPLPVNFGTFHACFYNILNSENYIKNSTIISGTKRIALIKEIIKEHSIEADSEDFYEETGRRISLIKNKGLQEITDSQIKTIFYSYETYLKNLSYIDFDDMLLKTYEMFQNNASILQKWQKKFSYFLIDEAQDMNSLSYNIIKMLAATNNIFMVGDDDQSIYGFRGADPSILMQFVADYPNTRQVLLDYNYRCPSNIVESSLSLINNNTNRFNKIISAVKPAGSINIMPNESEYDEAFNVVHTIKSLIKTGVKPCDIAILYRNHNIAHTIIEKLVSSHLPFYLKDNMPNIYTHWIMQDFEALFFIAEGHCTRERLLRIINKPNHYISRFSIPEDAIAERNTCQDTIDAYFSHMSDYYSDKAYMISKIKTLYQHFKNLAKLRPIAAVNYILKNMGYNSFLKEYAAELGIKPDSFLETVESFESLVRNCSTLKAAIDHLYTMRREVDYKNEAKKNLNGISLLTLHSAKGLEFDHVFIIGENEGINPSKLSLKSSDLLEEERRLFYVGITRAKSTLTISYRNKKLHDKILPSRFIMELKSNN